MNELPRLIGLTGTNGAGKGEVAAHFVRKGFSFFSLSDVLREELSRRGEKPTRDNLIRIGNELRERFGAEVLARRVMGKVKGPAVIDSIRNPGEVEFFRNRGNFVLLAVDAPIETRFRRAQRRGRDESAGTLDEFKKKENEEMTGSETGQQLAVCMKMADRLIVNDGSLDDLRKKLEDIQ